MGNVLDDKSKHDSKKTKLTTHDIQTLLGGSIAFLTDKKRAI